jgi:transcription initiation factor TFIID TATA-box-binding protein
LRIRIENVVASAQLAHRLDLDAISLRLPGAEYARERFPGLIYHAGGRGVAVLLFQSGKVVCTGGKSHREVKLTIRKLAGQLRELGQATWIRPRITIQNMVATTSLGREVNLNFVAMGLGLDRVEYEPEQFPGLVYRIDSPKVVVLLFASGRMVCTGARRPSDLERAVSQFDRELQHAVPGAEGAPMPVPPVLLEPRC